MLTIDRGEDGSVILSGWLDAAQCAATQSYLDKLSGEITVDCAHLEYISSAGLGVLLKTQKRLSGSTGKLRLVSVGSHLNDIFQYSGFDQIFEIVRST
jgi:anti-sigma B factor antagonist